MQIEYFTPSIALHPYIKKYMIIRCEKKRVNNLLPDTSLVMAFRLNGSTYDGKTSDILPSSALAGLTQTARLLKYYDKSANILVLFKETGAASFFRQPLHELFGLHVSLDNMIDRQYLYRFEDQLAACYTNEQRIMHLEKFLLSIIFPDPDPIVNSAIRYIRSKNGNIRVTDLVSSLNTSIDPFEKRFRSVVGISPKRYAAIIRMQHIINTYSRDRNFTEMALDAGFFDQSHFIRDFKTFTGETPNSFFRNNLFW